MTTTGDVEAAGTKVALAGSGAARLRRVLSANGLEVVGSRAATADVLVLRISGPAFEPAAQIRAARERWPDARVVVVSAPMSFRQVRVLLTEGVHAFVREDEAERALHAAVLAAAAGLLALPGDLRQSMVKPVLSSREKQVLSLVVLGLTNGEIARKLHLTESTVKSHLSSSFTKLGARSRGEATALILDPATGLGAGILAITGDS